MSVWLLLMGLVSSSSVAQDGAALYEQHCAYCHDSGTMARAPRKDVLGQLSAERIVILLESGSMFLQGLARTPSERQAIAEFLAGEPLEANLAFSIPPEGRCSETAGEWKEPFAGPLWNGWSVAPTNSRFQAADMAGLTADDVPRLKLKWAFAFAGDLRSVAQPAVLGGRLFVGSSGRRVYSLDSESGCIHWVMATDASVRTAMSLGPSQGAPSNFAVYFGDTRANVYAVDARSGEVLWKTQVDDHPAARITGAPRLHSGRLFVPVSSLEEVMGREPSYECCGFRGSVVALDTETGGAIWKTHTIPDPPRPIRKNKNGVQLWGPSGAAVWSTPTLDLEHGALYIGTGNSYMDPAAETSDAIIAMEMDTGRILWSRQTTSGDAYNLACHAADPINCPDAHGPDFDFASPPILVELGGGRRALVAGQESGEVHALDPDQEGRILWQVRIAKGSGLGGIQWGPGADERNVYAAVSDIDLGRRDGVRWPNPEVGGGLFALKLDTGAELWRAPPPVCRDEPCSPAQSAAVTVIPGVVFSGSVDGHMRAYATTDGSILWDFDTAIEYETVNGVPGKGGAIDGPGPVVVDGVLYVNSGYGVWGGKPGNVLLAFSVGDE